MSLLLLPVISVIIWIIILYKWTSSYLRKWENLYIYFRFLFSLIVIFLLYIWWMWLIIWSHTKFLDITDNIILVSNLILVWLPILWSSIWIWLLWKYLFNFILYVISYTNKLNKGLRYLKIFLFIILTLILLFIINSTIIYALIIYFKMVNLWWEIITNIYVINSLLIWSSWFWLSIWLTLLISWFFIYYKKLLSKENNTNGKKLLYTILCFVLLIIFSWIINLWSLFSLIVTFQLIDYNIALNNLNIWLLLWGVSIITWIIQWYSFLNYQKGKNKIYVPILIFIISNIFLVLSLVYAFNIISNI
jgi:hypothetical protein